jgi:hypothetical protein
MDVPLNLVKYVQLVPVSMDIDKGIIELMQFNVVNYKFIQAMNNSQLQAHITFQRKIMYQMTNTYLPTVSLLVIVELTMYIDESRLEVTISLSLTVMLVMYTFYQSISLLIPQTAYLKFIDYWLIFCLLGPFLIFITECFWYLYQSRPDTGWMKDENKLSAIILNHKGLTRFLIVSATLLFITIYSIVSVCLYCSR